MLGFKILWAVIVALMAVNYDTSHTTVVLIPDSDGHVGEVSVSNQSGSKTLTQAYTVVKAKQGDNSLSEPSQISESETKKLFAIALAAQPKSAKTFILYFNTGGTQLTAESQETLTQVISIIKQSATIDIYINGHTDTQGSDEINYKIALKRAKFVADLISSQLAYSQTSKIQTSSYGEGDPLVKTADNVKEAQNRRVEVTIHL